MIGGGSVVDPRLELQSALAGPRWREVLVLVMHAMVPTSKGAEKTTPLASFNDHFGEHSCIQSEGNLFGDCLPLGIGGKALDEQAENHAVSEFHDLEGADLIAQPWASAAREASGGPTPQGLWCDRTALHLRSGSILLLALGIHDAELTWAHDSPKTLIKCTRHFALPWQHKVSAPLVCEGGANPKLQSPTMAASRSKIMALLKTSCIMSLWLKPLLRTYPSVPGSFCLGHLKHKQLRDDGFLQKGHRAKIFCKTVNMVLKSSYLLNDALL